MVFVSQLVDQSGETPVVLFLVLYIEVLLLSFYPAHDLFQLFLQVEADLTRWDLLYQIYVIRVSLRQFVLHVRDILILFLFSPIYRSEIVVVPLASDRLGEVDLSLRVLYASVGCIEESLSILTKP